MGQNMNKKRPLVWAHNSTREVILGWMDSFNIDADNEAVDCLVRRIHAAALPFDADPMTLLDCLVEAIHWQADRIDGRKAANLLRHEAEQISDAFADAGLIDGQHCVGTTTPDATDDGQSPDAEPEQRDGRNAEEESNPTPGEVGQMIAALLLHLAQMERSRLRERQAAGIAAAKADGKTWGGRKPGTGLKADPERVIELRRRGLTIREVAASLGISTRTVSRMVKRAEGSHDAAC